MKNIYTQKRKVVVLLCLFFFISFHSFAQVGIGNTDPKSALDVNGALSLREGPNLNIGNGVNINLGAIIYSHYRITDQTADFNIKTFNTLNNVSSTDGQLLTLINTTPYKMTIVHDQGSDSNPQRRIYCPSGYDLVLIGQNSTVTFQYNSGLQRWVILGYADLGGYGRNVYNKIGTTDINTNADTFGNMEDMSVTLTPKHSIVYLNFSASGTMDKGAQGDSQGYGDFQIRKDNTPVAGTSALATDRSYIDSGTPSCGEMFYDSGGQTGNYSPNENYLWTLSPTNSGEKISVEFLSFATEVRYDGLMIYNGPDDTYPLISSGAPYYSVTCPAGAWSGRVTYSPIGLTFTSTAPGGELTFKFRSDYRSQDTGWEACVTSNVGGPSSYSLDTAWNTGFSMYPISVTPGVQTTIKIMWRRGGNFPKTLRNNATNRDRFHRNITVFD